MNLSKKLQENFKKTGKTKVVCRPEILLCQNIPKPMHGVAPRVVLGAKWWDQTRKLAYKSNSYHCLACGVWKHHAKGRKWLEGHELYDVNYQTGRMVYVETVPLCHFCHNYIHDGRLKALLDSGKVHHSKYIAILQHGDAVLSNVNLKRPTKADRDKAIIDELLAGNIAEWRDWRLVIGKKLYKPKFKSEAQWRKAIG